MKSRGLHYSKCYLKGEGDHRGNKRDDHYKPENTSWRDENGYFAILRALPLKKIFDLSVVPEEMLFIFTT